MRHKYLKDVVTLSLNAEKCVGCELCMAVCPHGVFIMNEGKTQIIDKDFCIECGACALNCPVKALEVNPGTGCAAAFITEWLTGSEPSCDCSVMGAGCC